MTSAPIQSAPRSRAVEAMLSRTELEIARVALAQCARMIDRRPECAAVWLPHFVILEDYVARLVLATHPQGEYAAPATNQSLQWGASPRGAQTIALAAKVRALLGGRYNVSFEDVRRVYLPAMRHRVILNFEAEAEGTDPDTILVEVLKSVPEKADEPKAA